MGLPKETKELVETILAMDPTLTYEGASMENDV